MRHRRRSRLAPVSLLAVGAVAAAGLAVLARQTSAGNSTAIPASIHKIKHVIVIMRENRSFDSYFGAFPGADGIPAGVCLPDPRNGGCSEPWVDHHDSNGDDPHYAPDFRGDVAGGKMNGFLSVAEKTMFGPDQPCHPDVLGYHAGSDIPNYWAYASNFVLQDHMFAAAGSWSLPAHLYEVSGWSAKCADQDDPMTCKSSANPPGRKSGPTPFGWTDLTYLLHKNHASWGYYLDHGAASDHHRNGVWVIWNVMPGFADVRQDGQAGNVRPLGDFYRQAKAGTLPNVSWITPDLRDSEHAPALVSSGQVYVTKVINAVMRSPDWKSTAISSCPGMTGAGSMTTSSHRPWTRWATASGCQQ